MVVGKIYARFTLMARQRVENAKALEFGVSHLTIHE